MDMNKLKPSAGAKKSRKRLGRGFSGGKTCGVDHKGQKSRSGGKIPSTFEGGQMPIQRRLPKHGFVAKASLTHEEVKLYNVNSAIKNVADKDIVVDMEFLRLHGVIKKSTKTVKVILSGTLDKKITLKGLPATKGVIAYLEKSGSQYMQASEVGSGE